MALDKENPIDYERRTFDQQVGRDIEEYRRALLDRPGISDEMYECPICHNDIWGDELARHVRRCGRKA